jgi:CheY-like chemotaxis protein
MADVTRKRTILVVDDEPDVVTFLTTLLQDHGYETSSAATGAEAMQRIRAARPDLVTLDITMPEQSGVKTYRQIKENPALATIPVVIVTGVTDDFKGFISSRKQVPPPDGYVSKPIVEQTFLELIRKLLW